MKLPKEIDTAFIAVATGLLIMFVGLVMFGYQCDRVVRQTNNRMITIIGRHDELESTVHKILDSVQKNENHTREMEKQERDVMQMQQEILAAIHKNKLGDLMILRKKPHLSTEMNFDWNAEATAKTR